MLDPVIGLLALSLAAPLVAALGVGWSLDPRAARRRAALGALTSGLAAALAASLREGDVHFGPLVLDHLNAALLPLGALIGFGVVVGAPRLRFGPSDVRRWCFGLAAMQATFASGEPLTACAVSVAAMVPAWRGLRDRSPRAARIFRAYMVPTALASLLGAVGLHLGAAFAPWGAGLLAFAILVRKGVLPFHSWVPEAFEHGPLPAAILFSAPQVAAYLAARFVVPVAPPVVLTVLGHLAVVTAVYGAAASLVQRDPRRALGFLFLSQSALVVVGLDSGSPHGLSGALLCWLSSGLSLAGFGLTLWMLEARRGSMDLQTYHGGFDRMPVLAASFLVLGLATAGFPGTLGFVGTELLVEGAVGGFRWLGLGVAVAAGLSAITVLRMYLSLFTGARGETPLVQRLLPREYLALGPLVLALALGGLAPSRWVDAAEHAARALLTRRAP